MNRQGRWRPIGAHYVLPGGMAAMLGIGAIAAGLRGEFSPIALLVTVAALVALLSTVTESAAGPLLGLIGWLTVVGFSRPPYGQLRVTGALAGRAAVVMTASSLVAVGIGMLARRVTPRFTVRIMRVGSAARAGYHGPETSVAGLDRRRQAGGALLAVILLPLVTVLLSALRGDLSLDDEVLIFLVVVVAVAVAGGFWAAVSAAIAASVLLNWYFTPPIHTFTIARPQNLLTLLLFVVVAMTVSSVVHLAAQRAVQAKRNSEEASSLLALAQTVLSGDDSPNAVLTHLVATAGGTAELHERVGGQWVRVVGVGHAAEAAPRIRASARDDVALVVADQIWPVGGRLLDGFAAQAAAALDRERLRTQAAQSEALAEGNRMRNALLAAVSHDLRTPLASIKASVSTLRQGDVAWTAQDQAELLAAIETSADRLDALVGNLLDMSRLRTASLQPFLHAAAVEEVAPLALRGLDGAGSVRLAIPEGVPLVLTDVGLLERVLANLFANALAYSPADRPPEMHARSAGDAVLLDVVDHGPGVPDQFKQRMFEPFERLGAVGAGTSVGLGLAVAKGLAEAMGATITAADTPGGGLTMRVCLPVAGRAAAALGDTVRYRA